MLLDEITQHPVIYLIAWTLPWLLFGRLRVARYVRYFHLAGYKSKRYSRWLSHNSAEYHYFWFCSILSSMLVGIVLVCLITARLTAQWSAILYIAFAMLAFCLVPRDHGSTRLFVSTARTTRLIVTSCVIQALPVIVAAFAVWLLSARASDQVFSPAYGLIILLVFGFPAFLLSLIAGPSSYLLASYAPHLANLINWPIDRLLHARTIAPIPQGTTPQ